MKLISIIDIIQKMEDSKLKTLKPKTKLRELKAIQKGEQSFKKTLGRIQ